MVEPDPGLFRIVQRPVAEAGIGPDRDRQHLEQQHQQRGQEEHSAATKTPPVSVVDLATAEQGQNDQDGDGREDAQAYGQAVSLAVTLEWVASVYYHAIVAGTPRVLSEDHLDAVRAQVQSLDYAIAGPQA